MSSPTISIISVVKNGASTIACCLASVRDQSIAAEHIIIDACSTDATLDIVRRVSPGARIVSEPDRGIYDAMNKGIALARGEVIGILNVDDFYPDRDVLARAAAVFRSPDIDSCYGDLHYVKDSNGTHWDHGQVDPGEHKVVRIWKSGAFNPDQFYQGWMPPHPTFFVRRHIYSKLGMFNLEMGSAADYELMLRFLLRHRISSIHIPQVMVMMRTGGVSNASIGNRLRANLLDRQAWRVNDLKPFPWTLTLKPLRKGYQYFVPAIAKFEGRFRPQRERAWGQS